MRWILSLALCLYALTGQAQDYASQMQFTLFQPCKGSASFCGTRVLASGVMDAGAADRLAQVIASQDNTPTIVFDSPGGSLLAGIEMGEYIRAQGLDTAMESSYTQEEAEGPETVFAAEPICYSACAYAFMGGVSRSVADGARIGVHQFRGATGDDVEATAQVTVALLSQYMKRMGVDRDILDAAGFTESAGMTELGREIAQLYNLDNTSPPLAPWELKATNNGELMLGVRQQQAGADARTIVALVPHASTPGMLRMVVGFDSMDERPLAGVADAADYTTGAELCSAELCAPLTIETTWRKGADAMELTATYVVASSTVAQVVASGGPLEFVSGFPNAAAVDPSVTLGSTGLSNGLRAMARH